MSDLISGKEALIALASGKEVQWVTGNDFQDITDEWQIREFLHPSFKFRLKPRIISINGIEVPAPFEPCAEDDCRAYVIDTRNVNGYDWQHSSHCNPNHIVWRTEGEIKQVVAALRSIFKGGVK